MATALRLLRHHPLTGVGLGGYGRYVGEPPLISSAVSTFLTVGAELGLVGLALLIAAIAVTSTAGVSAVLRATSADRIMLAGFVAAYIALAAANAIGEIWMNDFQWILFGLLIALTAPPALKLRSRRGGSRIDVAPRAGEQAAVVA